MNINFFLLIPLIALSNSAQIFAMENPNTKSTMEISSESKNNSSDKITEFAEAFLYKLPFFFQNPYNLKSPFGFFGTIGEAIIRDSLKESCNNLDFNNKIEQYIALCNNKKFKDTIISYLTEFSLNWTTSTMVAFAEFIILQKKSFTQIIKIDAPQHYKSIDLFAPLITVSNRKKPPMLFQCIPCNVKFCSYCSFNAHQSDCHPVIPIDIQKNKFF